MTKRGETTDAKLEEMKKDLNVSKQIRLPVCLYACRLSECGPKKAAEKPLACDCREYSRPLCLEAQVGTERGDVRPRRERLRPRGVRR